MSLDLAVPIVRNINVDDLTNMSAVILQRILRQPALMPVHIEESVGGLRTPMNDGELQGDRLYMLSVEYPDDSDVELLVMREAFEMSDKYPRALGSLCLSIRGVADAHLKAPFAAAIAIAIASLQNTVVYDDAQNWTDESPIASEALFKRMAIQRVSRDLQSAATDACRRMNKPIA